MKKYKLMLVGVIIAMLFSGCGELTPEERAASALQIQKTTAYIMTHGFVTERLVSPSTAKFPSSLEARITVLKPNHFLVTAYVDSQNSFGAMIRSNYTAEMAYLGNDRWRLVSLEIF